MKQGGSLNWQQQKDYAESLGGRLLTVKEIRDYIKNVKGDKEVVNSWVAVTGANDKQDYVWAGGPKPGGSHVEADGYPKWGDTIGVEATEGFEKIEDWRNAVFWVEGDQKDKYPIVHAKPGSSPNW